MQSQVAKRRERLVARLADIWLLPRMRGHGIFKPNKRLTWSASTTNCSMKANCVAERKHF
jgi:hypothetical protein